MAADPARRRLAPAKVNLTLHLKGQRADGYHLLESLVVFPALGDVLHVEPAKGMSLSVSGPFGDQLSSAGDNLILQAAIRLADHHGISAGAAFHLEKNLPVASGIGGGSSDAAAALRLLSDAWGVDIPPGVALAIGADVPVCCAAPVAQIMSGVGEVVHPAPPLPPCWVVLVNPLVGVHTGAVFSGVSDKNPPGGQSVPASGFGNLTDLVTWLAAQRNDLQAAAMAICPPIGEVLRALAEKAIFARMSGSGATCFALYGNARAAEAHAEDLRARTPWWVAAAPLGTD